jgi:hypothetical protein
MKKIGLLIALLTGSFTFAQTTVVDDTSSVDKIVNAMYNVISGPAGLRNWDRFKNLFTEGADMGAIFKNQQGEVIYRAFSPDDYIKNNEPFFLKNAFVEKEIHRTTNTYGGLVNIFTTYSFEAGEEKARGINSLQLVFSANRWWIASLIWLEETPDNLLPKEYLPK